MAVQKHILILHNRKKQNANAIWIMILGCFSLCSFTTLCLLFNDWTLLPQAYNPKPLILGEALFDLNPDLFPYHQQENGKWEKLINKAKTQTNQLVKRFNDWNFVRDVLPDQEEQDMSKDRSTKNLLNARAKRDDDFITVLMRKRSTNEDARPSFRIRKSFSVGSGERKEAKSVKERNKLLQPLSTQSQPSSPTSVESMEVDSVPVKSILKTKTGLKKRVRTKDRVQFAKNEKVRLIRDRVSPERNILYNTEGGQMRTSNDYNGKDKEDDRLVKRSGDGLPPLAPLNREDSAQSLSNYESEWKGDPDRHLCLSSSKRVSRSPSPAFLPESSRRTASYDDVQNFLRHERGGSGGGEIDWLVEADRHSRTTTRRTARTPSPTPLQRIRGTERLSPSHSVSPFHSKNTQRRRHSFESVDRELDKLGELSIVQSSASKSSLRPKGSPRARRVSFEGTGDYRSLHSSNSPRILSTRHSGRSEGLSEALHISSPDKGNLQKRELYHDQEMQKRCTDCFSSLKSRSKKSDEDMLPLRSNSQHEKSRLLTSSSIPSQAKVQIVSPPQRQAFSPYTQKQAPLKDNDDLRKYAIVKNAASTVKVMKRSFSADEGSNHLPPSPPEKQSWEYPIPNKSILKPKDRTRNQVSELRHVTFAEGTKLESSSKPRSSFRRKGSKVLYDAQRPSNIIERNKVRPPLSNSFQVNSSNESNRNTGTRRPYVSSMARFTSKQPRTKTSIIARRSSTSSTTKSHGSDSDDERSSSDSGSTLNKRAISENGSRDSNPTKSSLRSTNKPKGSSKVRFGGVSSIEIPARESGSPGSPVKEAHDMFTVKPTVLFDASKQTPQHQTSSSKLERVPSHSTSSTVTHDSSNHQHTTANPVTRPSSTSSTTSSRSSRSSTSSTSSSSSSYSRSADSRTASLRDRLLGPPRGHKLLNSNSRSKFYKRSLLEKRGEGEYNKRDVRSYLRSNAATQGPPRGHILLNSGFRNKYYKRNLIEKRGEGEYMKRGLIEKRARKRKSSSMSHVSSSESFIHTADHIAQYGVTPLKKSKQKQQPQKTTTTSATTSELSPSGLGFSGLHINSKTFSPTESNHSKGSMSMSRDRLSRSDSLRSTGSSSFRSLDDHSSSPTRPGSPSSPQAQRGQWWSGHSGSSSGGGVPFVY